jgi:WD40 repeat protein
VNCSLKFFLSLYGHKLPALTMDISSDSTLLVTGSADKNIKVRGCNTLLLLFLVPNALMHKDMSSEWQLVHATSHKQRRHNCFSVAAVACSWAVCAALYV